MKLSLLIALTGWVLALNSQAVVTLTLRDATTSANNVTISPGQTFAVALTLTSTGELTSGLTYFLEGVGPASGKFVLISRSLTASVFPDFTTDDGIAFSAATAPLDPVNNNDLGGLTAAGTNAVGSFNVATLVIQSVPGLTPGAYTIRTNGAEALDAAFDSIPIQTSGYTVNVVPEAASSMLLILGTAAGLLRRRR